MEKPNLTFKQEKEPHFLSKEEILNLSPAEMANYLASLEEKGELEFFLEDALEDESLKANFSYWEKWLEKDQRDLLDKIIEKKKEIYSFKSESLPLNLEERFTEKDLKLIFSNLEAVQLTFGCSKGCPFCGFDAIKGIREHIPYSQLVNMFQKYGNEISQSEPFLYWASEPSDYSSQEGLEDKTYEDIHQLAVRYANYDPDITSSNIRDKKWIDFMVKRSALGSHERRFSVFGMSDEKLQALRHKVYVSKIELGESNIAVNLKVRLYGKHYKHVRGMGKNFREKKGIEDDIPKSGIACVDGILLTPRGIYNMVVVPVSKEYPQGVIIVPLERITDEPIKTGDNLKEIMRRSVIEGCYSHAGAGVKTGDKFQKYIGEFPKQVEVHTSTKKYSLLIDASGNVLASNILEQDESHKIDEG